ncbi:MAG TPA: DUF3703 domain-containing protein [Pyrinomonadaceae bacterium]|nr:DUF3703 domain-containing protein [Pyrinomonadaceae bacterium]
MGISKAARRHIDLEIGKAIELLESGAPEEAFQHLERAHVLGQADTAVHTRVHWLMLKAGIRRGDLGEVWGQVIRIIGAATKTPLGIYPKGNTGGANVYFFKPMPIAGDLQAILDERDQ